VAINGLAGHLSHVVFAASRRLVGYLLQPFRADHAGPLTPRSAAVGFGGKGLPGARLGG
jgi:hypothetical protein